MTAKINETMFKKAISAALTQEYETSIPTYTTEHVFSDRFEKQTKKLINRQKKSYYKMINTAGKRAACIVVAIFAISFTTVMSVSALRNRIRDFFMFRFSDHVAVTVMPDESSNYPQTIETEYEISNIPSGYSQTDYCKIENSVYADYSDGKGNIFYEQDTKDSYNASLDNEHSEIYYFTDDNGQEFLVQKSEYGSYTLIWDDGEYVFSLCWDNETVTPEIEQQVLDMAHNLRAVD
jgi:hypothetical protein